MAVKNAFINYNSLRSDIQSQHIDMLTHTPGFTDKAYASPRLNCMFELALLKISCSDISENMSVSLSCVKMHTLMFSSKALL